MLHYFWESWAFVLPAFLLGCVVGYLLWRLRWRKVRTSAVIGDSATGVKGTSVERTADVAELDRRYQGLVADRDNQSRAFSALQFELNGLRVALSERDAKIATLTKQGQLDTSAGENASGTSSDASVAGVSDGATVRSLVAVPSPDRVDLHEPADVTELRARVERMSADLADRTRDLTAARADLSASNARLAAIKDQPEAVAKIEHEKALSDLRTERDRVVSGLRADHEEALAKYRRRAEAAETELQTARAAASSLQTDIAKLRAEHISVADRLKSITDERDALSTKSLEHDTQLQGFTSSVSAKDSELSTLSTETAKLREEYALQVQRAEEAAKEAAALRVELTASKAEAKALGDVSASHELAVAEHDATVANLKSELGSLRNALDEVRGDADRLRSEHQTLVGDRGGVQSALDQLRAEHTGLVADRDGLRAELDRLRSELAGSQQETERVRGEHSALVDQHQGVIGQRDSERGELDRLRGELDQLRGETETLRGTHQSLLGERQSLVGERDGANSELDRLRGELQRINAESEGLRGERDALVGDRDAARREIDQMRTELDGARNDLGRTGADGDAMREQITSLQSELDGRAEEVSKLRSEVEGLHSDRDGQHFELERLQKELSARDSELSGLRGQFESANGDLHGLRTEIDQLKTAHTNELDSLRGELDRVKGEHTNAFASLEQTKASGESATRELVDLREQFQKAEEDRRRVEAELETLRDELGNAAGELDVTKAQHEEQVATLRAEHDRLLQLRVDALTQEHTRALAEGETRRQQLDNERQALRSDLDRARNELTAAMERSTQSPQGGSSTGFATLAGATDLAAGAGLVGASRIAESPDASDESGAAGIATSGTATSGGADSEGRSADDDLQRIEGVGPRFEEALKKAGLRSFSSLAGASEQQLRNALAQSGLGYAPSLPTWAEQARLIVAGDEAGHAELKAKIIAARVSGGQSKDDLQRIEGIGPRIEQALVSSGITTYRDVSRASEQRLRAALEAAGLSFAPSLTTWAEQATLLARGDEDGFAKLSARLIAGKGK